MLQNYFYYKLFIFVALLHSSLTETTGKCNECMSNNVACVDDNHFVICHKGTPVTQPTACDGQLVCTDDINICRDPAEGFEPICVEDNCNNCKSGGTNFACISERSYGYCFGGDKVVESTIRECPDTYVCSVNNPEKCVPEATNNPSCKPLTDTTTTTDISTTTTDITTSETTSDTTTEDSTTLDTTTTTTETTPTTITTEPTTTPIPLNRDPNTLCADMQAEGKFKPDIDPTCKEYILCWYISGEYLGYKYDCQYYFNPDTGACQNEKPPNC